MPLCGHVYAKLRKPDSRTIFSPSREKTHSKLSHIKNTFTQNHIKIIIIIIFCFPLWKVTNLNIQIFSLSKTDIYDKCYKLKKSGF